MLVREVWYDSKKGGLQANLVAKLLKSRFVTVGAIFFKKQTV
jgi:hypothetical protein